MYRDLNHSNQYIVGLALCALGNICSAEMARDLAPEVERLLQFRDPNIRKKVSFTNIFVMDLRLNVLLLKEHHILISWDSVNLLNYYVQEVYYTFPLWKLIPWATPRSLAFYSTRGWFTCIFFCSHSKQRIAMKSVQPLHFWLKLL